MENNMEKILISFLIFLLLVGAAAAKDKSSQAASTAPKLVERRDVPLQITRIVPEKVPGQCKIGILANSTCTKVWAVATQSFDKKEKHITLLVNVTSSDDWFSSAALAFSIDGNVTRLPAMDWHVGAPSFIYGSTARIKDETLVQSLSTASDVWVTVFLSQRISVKLDDRQLGVIKAVVERYNGL